jgi:hypothetical protein
MTLARYVWQQGDTPARVCGPRQLVWDAVWTHPANEILRLLRRQQGTPHPGDALQLPEPVNVCVAPGNNTLQARRDRGYYIQKSFFKAFGPPGAIEPPSAQLQQFRANEGGAWNAQAPSAWGTNRARIVRLYDYYRRVFLSRPRSFLWAGLGRMAGGAVVGGVDMLVRVGAESEVTEVMVAIGKAIFLDMAWQHEAYADDPARAIALAAEYDAEIAQDPAYSYAESWRLIQANEHSDTERAREAVSRANLMFLHNEQWRIIQPFYDRILADPFMRAETGLTSAVTNNIHPYHSPFLQHHPGGNIFHPQHRWGWIVVPGSTDADDAMSHPSAGMWAGWVNIPEFERARLVNLSLDEMHGHRWGERLRSGPGVPPGAYDSES